MKIALVFVLVCAAYTAAQKAECGGGCVGSTDCAAPAGDLHCRCTNFACGLIEGNCGGGCFSDDQCAKWAGEDPTCICSNLICRRASDPATPQTLYKRINHFRALLNKSPSLRQKFIEANDFAKVAHLAK